MTGAHAVHHHARPSVRPSVRPSRLPAAERLLLASLALNAGHPEANLFAALCAARRKDDASALALLGRAYELAPHNAEIVRDYGALLVRVRQPALALPILQRAVHQLAELHAHSATPTAHAAGALASAHVKLAACYLLLNRHGQCEHATASAVALDAGLAPVVAPMHQLCARARKEGIDTSAVSIDLGM